MWKNMINGGYSACERNGLHPCDRQPASGTPNGRLVAGIRLGRVPIPLDAIDTLYGLCICRVSLYIRRDAKPTGRRSIYIVRFSNMTPQDKHAAPAALVVEVELFGREPRVR